MPITRYRDLQPDQLKEVWDLYLEVFTPLAELAAQNHVMDYSDFVDVSDDKRIIKYLARDDTGRLLGVCVLTNDLESWRALISLAFFAKNWPDEFARKAIWYVGFVGARPNDVHVFRDLVLAMYEDMTSNDGISFMDYCSHNDRIPEITVRLMNRAGARVATRRVDTQSFYILERVQEVAA